MKWAHEKIQRSIRNLHEYMYFAAIKIVRFFVCERMMYIAEIEK